MDLMIRLQVYIISLAVLVILYIQLKEESQSYSLKDRLFRHLILFTIDILCLESLAWIVNGKEGEVAYIINMGSNILLLMISGIPLTIWTFYIIEIANNKKKVLNKYTIILIVPIIINMMISLSTPLTHKYFYIDEKNVYHRGDWLVVLVGIHVLLIATNIFVTLYNWEKLNPRNRVPMLLFMLPPIIGYTMQIMFYGTSLIWPGTTISIFMSYLMVQSQAVKTDYLTGVYNRREMDTYIERKIKNLPKGKKFAGIMVDLDDFKDINDNYGHAVGDKAIRMAAHLIKKSVRRDDFVARYGGDEFIIIVDIRDENEFKEKIENLKREFRLFNDRKEEKFELRVSVGCSTYNYGEGLREDFLNQLDQLMYKDKLKRKVQR